MIPKPRIYLSTPVDQHLEPKQVAIKKAIIEGIEAEGFEPQEFFNRGIPLAMAWGFEAANDVMTRCQGAVVLAFSRWHWKDESGQITLMPTEYNHFEGALAIAHKLPLLVIAEEGVIDRGIVSTGAGLAITFIPPGTTPDRINRPRFQNQFQAWCDKVKSCPHVFLGYCSQARSTADQLTLYLERTLNVSVRNYTMDFQSGGTILYEIEKACRECLCGIFLFTKDDSLEGDANNAAPRDNVVFEAGYFMHAKGKERVLIIREDDAKMPADLGGNIYISLKDRNDISTIHTQLRNFLEERL